MKINNFIDDYYYLIIFDILFYLFFFFFNMFKEKFKLFFEKEKSNNEKNNKNEINLNKNENNLNKNEINSNKNFFGNNRMNLTKTKQNFLLESNAAKLSTSMNLTKLIKSIPHIHKQQISYNFESKNLIMTENINKYKKINNHKIFSFTNTEKIRIYNINSNKNNFNNFHCSFFGLYDGHAGNSCADFLRDNLHKFIINDKHFPKNPKKSIFNGFLKAESTFLKEFGQKKCDSSGSCAIVLLII